MMKQCDGCGQETLNEFAWLIEADGTYWDGHYADSRAFTPKHEDAIRLQDAEIVRSWLLQQHAFALKVSRHGWSNGEHR